MIKPKFRSNIQQSLAAIAFVENAQKNVSKKENRSIPVDRRGIVREYLHLSTLISDSGHDKSRRYPFLSHF